MKSEFHQWVINNAGEWIVYIFVFVIGIFGAVARNLYELKGSFNMLDLIKDCVTSAFVAILTYWFTQAIHLSPIYAVILIGICAHLGTRALVIAQKMAMNKFKLNIEVKEKDE